MVARDVLGAVGVVEVDDGVGLWVERTGGGPGVPLVLCHGGPGLWDNLGPLAALLDQDRLVVRWDQRGCGRSGGAAGPFTIERFLADLEAIRWALGIRRWVVGGHSWGASLALLAVLADPGAAAGLLYLSGTGLGRSWHAAYTAAQAERLTPEQLARCRVLAALEERSPAEEVEWRTLRWAPDFADRERAAELAAIDAGAPWPINWACNAAINAETKAWDEAALLDACALVDVPALLVHGAEDPRPPNAIEDVAGAIPRAEVSIVEDAGHAPWLERPGAVASILRSWLDDLTATRCRSAAGIEIGVGGLVEPPERVPSPGGWTCPPGRRAAWSWTPPGGATPRLDRVPRTVRIWYHLPLVDRWAYEWMWSRGGWDVEPWPPRKPPAGTRRFAPTDP